MRVIGVLDLAGGCAVHARQGQRELYRPVGTVAGNAVEPGDAPALARAYIERFGIPELYVADLDAIQGRPPQDALLTRLAELGVPLWLDAGVTSVAGARRARAAGASRIVVGLETLPSYVVLRDIAAATGRDRIAFSLDLRQGEPILAIGSRIPPTEGPDRIVGQAVEAGVGALIVIDLARVGTRRGPDFELIARVRDASPRLTLVAGGGIRGPDDLERLAAAGCDAALVATALLDGRVGRREVEAALAWS